MTQFFACHILSACAYTVHITHIQVKSRLPSPKQRIKEQNYDAAVTSQSLFLLWCKETRNTNRNFPFPTFKQDSSVISRIVKSAF